MIKNKNMKILMTLFMIMWFGLSIGQDNISLLLPYDGDTIETKNPLLTWSHFGGLQQNNGRVFYRLLLVELKEEQSAEAGIIVNQPLLKMDRLSGTQLFYPYDAPELEDGHRYGWQIQKIMNNVLVDKSEAFEFILPLPKPIKPQYYKLQYKNDGLVHELNDGKLFFQYIESYKQEQLLFTVYNSQGDKVNTNLKKSIQAEDDKKEEARFQINNSGSNLYELEGNNLSIGRYKLEVEDPKGRKSMLLFEVK